MYRSSSPGRAERGEGSGGCNRGDGLPPVPGTPSQQGVDVRARQTWKVVKGIRCRDVNKEETCA